MPLHLNLELTSDLSSSPDVWVLVIGHVTQLLHRYSFQFAGPVKFRCHTSTRSFDATRQTCYPSTFRYVEENERHKRLGQEVRSNTWMSRMLDRTLAVTTTPVTRTHAGTGCAQNWRRVKKEESILPENKHVWMQGKTGATLFIKPQTCCVRGMGSPTRKILANG